MDMGASACLRIGDVRVVVGSYKAQLADQAMEKSRGAVEYLRLMPLFASAIVRNFGGQPAEAEAYAREAAAISLETYPKTTSVYAEHAGELGELQRGSQLPDEGHSAEHAQGPRSNGTSNLLQ